MKIEFDEINDKEPTIDSINGMNGLKYAMAVAAAGGHHMLVWGKPGCGKTLALRHFPELLPLLTKEESESVTRIHFLAGLLNPNKGFMKTRPFRMPHQTCTLKVMGGGGVNCRPGEISLAHNGVLFLDEVAEFRSEVLQMLRVPLETGSITLCRAGRSFIYPAKFQLVMTATPCPCGNYGSKDRMCLCSMRAVEIYWRKFSAPLVSRIGIRYDCNAGHEHLGKSGWSLDILRRMVSVARERQYARQGKLNQDLSEAEIGTHCQISPTAKKFLHKATEQNGLSEREIGNIIRIARTVEDMTGGNELLDDFDMEIAMELHAKLPADFD